MNLERPFSCTISAFCLLGAFWMILCLSPPTTEAADGNRDILVLHSYHPDLQWTAGINKAISEELLSQNPGLSLHIEYLDTKRNPSNWYHDNYIESILVKKLTGRHYNLVISSDNNAFDFVLRHRNDLFTDIPVIFCGVNGFTPDMIEGHAGITGVPEAPDFPETIRLALQLQPDTQEIIFIGETLTATGRIIDQELRALQQVSDQPIKRTYWTDLPLSELTQQLQRLSAGQIVILSSVLTDQDGTVFSYTESAQQVRMNSPVPIYGVWDFFLGQGVLGGRMTNSEKQGQFAARLALRILNGSDPASISVEAGDANRYMFDFNELSRFGISLGSLPKGSKVINYPTPVYTLSKWQLLIGLLMGSSIFLLLYIIVIRRRNEKEIGERARLSSLAAEIGRNLTQESSQRESLQNCCESLVRHLGASAGRIWTVDKTDSDLLELQASAGLFTRIEKSAHRYKRVGEMKIGYIAGKRQPILTNQVQGDPLFVDQEGLIRKGIVSFAGYPLVVHDQLVGVIAFFSQTPLTEQVQHAIASVSDMIAVGIKRYRADEELQEALRSAEAGRDNIDAILRSVSDGLIVTDLEQRGVLLNTAAGQLLDISPSKSTGTTLEELTTGKPYAESLRAMLADSKSEVEFTVNSPSESTPTIIEGHTASVRRSDGSISGTVAILRNVTRQRELDRMKSEFIAVAAHELRTPLATIQGYAELLLTPELSEKANPEQQHEYLGYIVDRSEALEKIITDLLDVGRAETGRMIMLERSPCEMIGLVHEIVSHHRRESPTHTFLTDCPESCLELSVDRNMMCRVFDNLLSNAVKYSPDGGTIRISGEMSDHSLVITVQDEGVGMTQGQVDQAFTKFYRADTSDTAVRGLGLGLTICKTIIEAHGGRIWLDSSPANGTAVRFSLPLDL